MTRPKDGTKLVNVHPGELLHEEFLKPMRWSQRRLAKETKMPLKLINELIKGKRGITPEIDRCLCKLFHLSAGYWLRVQSAYGLRETKKRKGMRVNTSTRTMTMYIPWHPTFEDSSMLLTWMYRRSTRGSCYVPKNGTIARVTIHLPATGIIKKASK